MHSTRQIIYSNKLSELFYLIKSEFTRALHLCVQVIFIISCHICSKQLDEIEKMLLLFNL